MNLDQKTLDRIEQARREGRVSGTEEPIPGSTLPIPEPKFKPTSEKSFMWSVIAEAEKNGWKWYHVYHAYNSRPGFLDLVLWHLVQKRVMFVETKTETGKLSAAQEKVAAELRDSGAEVRVWRPSDWPTIVETLK